MFRIENLPQQFERRWYLNIRAIKYQGYNRSWYKFQRSPGAAKSRQPVSSSSWTFYDVCFINFAERGQTPMKILSSSLRGKPRSTLKLCPAEEESGHSARLRITFSIIHLAIGTSWWPGYALGSIKRAIAPIRGASAAWLHGKMAAAIKSLWLIYMHNIHPRRWPFQQEKAACQSRCLGSRKWTAFNAVLKSFDGSGNFIIRWRIVSCKIFFPLSTVKLARAMFTGFNGN